MSKLNALLKGAKNVDANSSRSGTYFPPDFEGVLEIVKCFHRPSAVGSKEFIIAEFKVVETNLDKVPVGGERSWAHDMAEKFYGIANTKAFVGAACGFEVDSEECAELDGDALEEAMSVEDNPIVGRWVGLKTNAKKTKAGKDFTVHNFSPADQPE